MVHPVTVSYAAKNICTQSRCSERADGVNGELQVIDTIVSIRHFVCLGVYVRRRELPTYFLPSLYLIPTCH